MYCIHCGAQLPDHAAFCNSCGNATTQAAPPPNPQQPAPYQPPQTAAPTPPQPQQAPPLQPVPTPRRSKKPLFIVLAVLLVVAVGGVAVFLSNSGEDPLEVHTAAVRQTIRSLERAMNDMDIDATAALWVPTEARKIRASDSVLTSLPLDSGDLALAALQAGIAFSETQITMQPLSGPQFSPDFTTATLTAQVSLQLPMVDAISVELLFTLQQVDEEWLISSWELAS